MSSVPFHYVDLRAFCYVTEDAHRVEDALRLFLPAEFELDQTESEGHYGGRILVLSARVENSDSIAGVLERLGELPDEQRQRVRGELAERVDEDGNLFLSLDKQAAFGGDVRLGEGLTLRAKVESYPAKRERAIDAATEALDEVL
jgi:RNA binding exosome subunit